MCVLSATDEELTPSPSLSSVTSLQYSYHSPRFQVSGVAHAPTSCQVGNYSNSADPPVFGDPSDDASAVRECACAPWCCAWGCFSVASATEKTLTLCAHVQSRTTHGCMTLAMVTTGRVVFLNTAHEGTSAASHRHCVLLLSPLVGLSVTLSFAIQRTPAAWWRAALKMVARASPSCWPTRNEMHALGWGETGTWVPFRKVLHHQTTARQPCLCCNHED